MKNHVRSLAVMSLLVLSTACGVVQVKGPGGASTAAKEPAARSQTTSAAAADAPAASGNSTSASSASSTTSAGSTTSASSAGSAGSAGSAAKVEDTKGAPRKAHIDEWTAQCDKVEAAIASVPADTNLIEDMDSKYPSTAYVKERQRLSAATSVLLHDNEVKDGPLSSKTPTMEELFAHPEYAPVKARLGALDEKLASAVKLPKEQYKGGDVAQVRAAFKAYAKTLTDMGKFVTVVIVDEDWDRKRGLDDDGRAFDQGFVTGYFVVDKGASHGEVWRTRPRKDWLDGGKIKFDVYAPDKITDIKLPLR